MEKQGNIQLGLGLKLEYGCDATAEMSEMSSHRERDINNNMQHNVESNLEWTQPQNSKQYNKNLAFIKCSW